MSEIEELEIANKELEREIAKHKSLKELQEEEKKLLQEVNYYKAMGLDD